MDKTDRKRTKGKPPICLRRPAKEYKKIDVLTKDDYIICVNCKCYNLFNEDGLYLKCLPCGERIVRYERKN